MFSGRFLVIYILTKDEFIEIGGARTLCALLHSKSERLMNEAVMAISYIVADSETNKHAIIAEDG